VISTTMLMVASGKISTCESIKILKAVAVCYSANLDHCTEHIYGPGRCESRAVRAGSSLQNLLNVLATVLEGGLLVMKFLLKFGDVLFQSCRLRCEALAQCYWRHPHEPEQSSATRGRAKQEE
jgi:hypothetical protein